MEAVIALPRRGRPGRGRARPARATSASSPTRARAPTTAQAVLLGVSESCRRHVLRELVDLRRARRRLPAPRRAGRRGRVLLRRAERRLVADAEEYYRTMFGDARRVVEPARPPHGRHARHLDGAPGPPRRHAPGRRLGAQLPHRRRAGHARWRARASSTSASSCASATAGDAVLVGLHHVHRHRHRGLGLGRAGRAQARAARRCPGATRRSSTPSACRPSCCARSPAADAGRHCASPGWSAPSA